jgi:hypothetical protein
MRTRLLSLVGPATTPPLSLWLMAAGLLAATESFGVYLLKQMEPGNVLGVIFVLGALAVSTVWGLRLGLVTGIGGADTGKGSDLTGLMDRVEALGGHMHISSQVGNGTAISVEIPSELRMTERRLSET